MILDALLRQTKPLSQSITKIRDILTLASVHLADNKNHLHHHSQQKSQVSNQHRPSSRSPIDILSMNIKHLILCPLHRFRLFLLSRRKIRECTKLTLFHPYKLTPPFHLHYSPYSLVRDPLQGIDTAKKMREAQSGSCCRYL